MPENPFVNTKLSQQLGSQRYETFGQIPLWFGNLARVEFLMDMTRWDLTNSNVLDVGAGSGFIASELCKQQPIGKINLLDNSLDMLQQAQVVLPEAKKYDLDISNKNLSDLINQKFDLLFSLSVFSYLDKDRTKQGINNLAKLSKSNSSIIFGSFTPNSI